MGMFDDLVPAPRPQAPPAPEGAGMFADLIPQSQAGNLGGEIVRQVGLTGRYAMEGLPMTVDFLASPLKALIDSAYGAIKGDPSFRSKTLSELGTDAATGLGLPTPQTPQERVVGDATRMGFSVAGGVGLGRAMAGGRTPPAPPNGLAQNVGAEMARNPGTQAAAAAAAGGAAGVTREQGGGPGHQAVAAFAAGLAAPFLTKGLSDLVGAGQRAFGARVAPERINEVLRTELARAGINWDDLGANVKLQLRKDAEAAVYSGQPLDPAALRRLADYRNVGATPLVGDITQDPRLLTLQRNTAKQMANMRTSAGAPDLPNLQNQNARSALNALDNVADSPLDSYQTGQRIIGNVTQADDAMRTAENALYARAKASAGRDIPLDRDGFLYRTYENLARENKGAFLPAEVGNVLKQIREGKTVIDGREYPVPFTVDQIDNLKTMLARSSRSTKDGNAKAALKIVRDTLEEVGVSPTKPSVGGNSVVTGATAAGMRAADDMPADALRNFDAARAAARERRTWQESAKFIEDALENGEPDKFVQKHIVGSSVAELRKLRDQIKNDPEAVEATRKQLVGYILGRGKADSDVTAFGSASMKDALKAIENKLPVFFDAGEIQQIRSAVNVARYTQSQPIGSAVGNSNTAAVLTGRLADLLTKGSPVPFVGPMIADPLQSLVISRQARQLADVSRGLAPLTTQANPRAAALPLSLLLTAPPTDRRQD